MDSIFKRTFSIERFCLYFPLRWQHKRIHIYAKWNKIRITNVRSCYLIFDLEWYIHTPFHLIYHIWNRGGKKEILWKSRACDFNRLNKHIEREFVTSLLHIHSVTSWDSFFFLLSFESFKLNEIELKTRLKINHSNEEKAEETLWKWKYPTDK